MGGKKKTKWRKVPPEELYHITVKRSVGERMKSKEQYHSDENSIKCSNHGNRPQQQQNDPDTPDFSSRGNEFHDETDACGPSMECDESDRESGYYINGLWVPTLEMQTNTASSSNIANFPISILRPIPLIIHHPPAFCPPTCPRFQSFHAPDVPLHPNNFIPSNSHYFYYLTKLQPKPLDELNKDEGTCSSASDFHNIVACSLSSKHQNPVPSSDGLPEAMKAIDSNNEAYDGSLAADMEQAVYHNFGDHRNPADHPSEASEDLLPSYEYPGYAFGQTLYSIPVYSVLPSPVLQAQAVPSLPVSHFQRRRRKKRKGYAEYAIIPKKSNTASSSSEKFQKNPIVPEENQTGCSSKQTQNKEEQKSNHDAKAGDLPTNKVQGPHLEILKSGDSAATKNRYLSLPDELLTYSKDLVDQILLSAKQEFQNCRSRNIDAYLKNSLDTEVTSGEFNGNNTVAEKHDIHSIVNDDVRKQAEELIKEVLEECFSSNELSNAPKSHQLDFGNGMTENMSNTSEKVFEEICDFKALETPFQQNTEAESDSAHNHMLAESENHDVVNQNANRRATEVMEHLEQNSNENTAADDPKYKSCNKIDTSSNVCSIRNRKSHDEIHNPLSNSPKKDLVIETCGKMRNLGSKTSPKDADASLKNHSVSDTDKPLSNNSFSSQYNYMSHMLSSEALIRETELELNKLHQLTSKSSLQPNQSIYKLAYDENLTDQSETEDQEVTVQTANKTEALCSESPNVISGDVCRSEILVHEADSASDAGSEDVELLPHRYESESAQKYNKHIYVNNLSLAVEMLRTRENLPYDDEFKRIVDDDFEQRTQPLMTKTSSYSVIMKPKMGTINPGFVEDHSYTERKSKVNSFLRANSEIQPNHTSVIASRNYHSYNLNESANQRELRNSIADSGVQSEDSGDEVGEEAKETIRKPGAVDNDKQRNRSSTNEANASHRRGFPVRQQFSIYTPRSGIVNPCLCCIIM